MVQERPHMSRIDTHVHCRDGRQAYKATIGEVIRLAQRHGIATVFDMPNKDPPVTSLEGVNEYVNLARRQGCLDGYHLYIGATRDMSQVREAAGIAKFHYKVIGMKFGTADFGGLTIDEPGDQRRLFRTLADEGYMGVMCVHCEDKSRFQMGKWDPERPWTWNEARPPEAEVSAAENQIKYAKEEGFEGTLYIPHVSVPETADLIDASRGRLNIVCGLTPHHANRSTEDMRRWNGIELKVNPPIREPGVGLDLLGSLLKGRIDWIETDHAPHTFEEKYGRHLSGYPSLTLYTEFLQDLRQMGVPEDTIEGLTYRNARRVFGEKIKEWH
jgi:dihydroorotase